MTTPTSTIEEKQETDTVSKPVLDEAQNTEGLLGALGPKFTGHRLLVGAAAAVIVGAGMVQMRAILAPFLFALLIAIAGALPLRWLQNRRVRPF